MERKKEYIKDISRLAKEFDRESNADSIDNITTGSCKTIYWICEKGHKWRTTPYHRVKRGQNCPYCAGNMPIKGENDLSTVHPDIAKEWHPTRNGNLKPEDFKPKSNVKIWWLCPNGHEYETQINVRTRGSGCPYCWGRYVIEGKTDLETLRPDIAKEWHPSKNGDIKPNTVTTGTSSKYWWMCPKGHDYEMRVSDRTRNVKAHGCPFCSGKKVIVGVNDSGTVCKEINRFWDYHKNKTVPSDYLPNSGAEVRMKCDKGHSWNTTILGFVKTPKCPYCSGTILEQGLNTLRALYPKVAEKWNYEKNINVDIDKVHVGSVIKKYWWKCEKGHEWLNNIPKMVKSFKKKGKGCPYCSGSISKYSI